MSARYPIIKKYCCLQPLTSWAFLFTVSPSGVPLLNTLPRMTPRAVTPQMAAPQMSTQRSAPSPVDPELEAVERSIESQMLNAKPRADRPGTAPPYDPTYATISEATKQHPPIRQGTPSA
jgi:hypothetical protein